MPLLYCVADAPSATAKGMTSGVRTNPDGSVTWFFTDVITISYDCTLGPGEPDCGCCLITNSYHNDNTGGPDVFDRTDATLVGDDSRSTFGSLGNTWTITVTVPGNGTNGRLEAGKTYILQYNFAPYNPGVACSGTNYSNQAMIVTDVFDCPPY